MEAFVKYVDPNLNNWTGVLNTLMSQIAANNTSVVYDGVNYNSSGISFPYSLGLNGTSSSIGTGPRAFMNWLFFDRDFAFKSGGYVRMTDMAREYGQDCPHEKLESIFVASEPGYLYIYLSNENDTPIDVYFDDLKVSQINSPILQVEDFYPFGLRYNSVTRESTFSNRFLYHNKTEYLDELGLNTYHFRFRMYDPSIGRFWSIDPLSEKFLYNSPYAFAENKLGLGIELEGLELFPVFSNTSILLEGNTVVPKPAIETLIENGAKMGGELGARSSKFSNEQLQNFARGNKVEAEQLAQNGLQKNTKPIEAIDPKTGQTGRTIPDAFKNGGKSTTEIKNVKRQGLTEQLRLQKSHSEGNGFKPELIINQGAKLSKTLLRAGFDIKRYLAVPAVPSDATKVAPSPAQMREKVQIPCKLPTCS